MPIAPYTSPALCLAMVASFLAAFNPKEADKTCLLTNKENDKRITNKNIMSNGVSVGKVRAPLELRQSQRIPLIRLRAIYDVLFDKYGTDMYFTVDEAWHRVVSCMAHEFQLWELSTQANTVFVNSSVSEQQCRIALQELTIEPNKFLHDHVLTVKW